MIPVETFERNDIVASYPVQDINKARAHRDRLRAEGKKSFMTRRDGRGRYDAAIEVWVEKVLAKHPADGLGEIFTVDEFNQSIKQ